MLAQYRFPRSFTLAAWAAVVLLAVIAVQLAMPRTDGLLSEAKAQQVPMLGARGVYAFPIQLTSKTYGICMIDVDAGTTWFYEYNPLSHKLRLASARSWIFDRFLEEYNVEGLAPNEVGELVSKQRSQRQQLETPPAAGTDDGKYLKKPLAEPEGSTEHKE